MLEKSEALTVWCAASLVDRVACHASPARRDARSSGPFRPSSDLLFGQAVQHILRVQYGLPVVSFADLSASLISRSVPTYWPLSFVAFSISGLAFWLA